MATRLRKLERLTIYSYVSTKDYIMKVRRLSKEERRVTEKSDIACQNRKVSVNVPFNQEFDSSERSIEKLMELLDNINDITLICDIPKDAERKVIYA